MPSTGQKAQTKSSGECRRCQSFCDKLVDPAGCIGIGCKFLYSYEDQLSGRTFIGCINKVFKGEIDLDAVSETGPGFGGIKVTGEPLPHCPFTVERAYEGDGPDHECINPRFFDCEDSGEEGFRAFDLRDALRPEA